jgi:hypothetical protein
LISKQCPLLKQGNSLLQAFHDLVDQEQKYQEELATFRRILTPFAPMKFISKMIEILDCMIVLTGSFENEIPDIPDYTIIRLCSAMVEIYGMYLRHLETFRAELEHLKLKDQIVSFDLQVI